MRLPDDAPPPPPLPPHEEGYAPFESRAQFEVADFLFREVQMSAGQMDKLMQLWGAYNGAARDPPFANHDDLYSSIDNIKLADIRWRCFAVTYTGPRPDEGPVPPWMDEEYLVWFRCPREVLHCQLGNPDFATEMHFSPRKVFRGNERVYKDFMSGDWAWKQAVRPFFHRLKCLSTEEDSRMLLQAIRT